MSYPDVIREIQITRSDPPTVADVRAAVLAIRRRKGMVIDPMDPDTRSVGSFFVNPVVDERTYGALTAADGRPAPGYPAGAAFKVPAAWLIEQSGLGRGHRDGRVGLSSKHPLAIVNRGGASARDVLAFAAAVRRRVFDRFGVSLKAEPVFVALDDDPDAVYLQQETG
jgi:UDP-N-acetylmuramate dehydrogenase